jgi:hypothetical protein
VFVETEAYGRPSALMVTQAEWWAYEVGRERWSLISTRELVRLAYRAEQAGKVRTGGRDGATRGVVIPKTWLVGVDL